MRKSLFVLVGLFVLAFGVFADSWTMYPYQFTNNSSTGFQVMIYSTGSQPRLLDSFYLRANGGFHNTLYSQTLVNILYGGAGSNIRGRVKMEEKQLSNGNDGVHIIFTDR